MPTDDSIINRVVVEFPVNGPGYGAFVLDTLRANYGLAVEIRALWDRHKRVLGDVVRGEGLSTGLGTVPLGVARNLAVALLMSVYTQSPGSWGFMSERDALECLSHLSEILGDVTGYKHPVTNPVGNLSLLMRRYRRAAAAVFKLRAQVMRLRWERETVAAIMRVGVDDAARLRLRIENQRKELDDRLKERQVMRNAIRGLGLLRVWAKRLAEKQTGEMAEAQEALMVKDFADRMDWTKKYE